MTGHRRGGPRSGELRVARRRRLLDRRLAAAETPMDALAYAYDHLRGALSAASPVERDQAARAATQDLVRIADQALHEERAG